jgi:hypothetical protein
MAYSGTIIDPYDIPRSVGALDKRAPSDFWTRSHPQLKAAGYVMASLIGLAIGPALFVGIDHDVVVRWSNGILDLVSR